MVKRIVASIEAGKGTVQTDPPIPKAPIKNPELKTAGDCTAKLIENKDDYVIELTVNSGRGVAKLYADKTFFETEKNIPEDKKETIDIIQDG